MESTSNDLIDSLMFTVSRVFIDFDRVWGVPYNKLFWVGECSFVLTCNNFDVETILKASQFCINNLHECPSILEFRDYCDQYQAKKN